MKQQIILTLRKGIVLVAMLSHTTGLWAQWWDTIYITAPSGQTLMCQRYIGPTFTRYTLIGDTSIAGNLTVPHTIIWPYTDSDGYTHYPTYIVSDLSFRNCHNLLSVAIQEGYTYISNSFEGCTNLTTVTLPSTMTSITGDAFKNCHALQTINIPNGVTTIGRGSFEGCASLESISLPNSITTLGARAFAGCTSLTNIVIPPLVDSVYGGTFHNCSSLQSVTLPDSLRTIGNYEFYYGSEAPLYHTREVGTFEGCTALTSVVLPNKVKHIGNYTFLGCTNLSSVTFPDSLERIGSLAFSECGLTNLILPSNLFQLDYGVFSRCINLQEVTISPQIRNIGSATFDSCVNLTTVNFNADSCFQGGGYCFSVGSSTCCLEGRVWHNCPNLTQVNIGNNVRYLMSNLFYDLTSLTSITIPPSVRKIAHGTFVGCTGLSTVNLNADSVNYHSLGSSGSPFIGCSNLSTLNIGNNVTIIPPKFMYGVSSLNNINLPESIRTICHYAFYGCSTGQSVLIIPNSVDSIAESAFRYCNFDTLVLGSSLRHIGSDAFVNNSIEAIFINAATPPFIYNEDNSNYYHNPSFSYDDFDNTELFVPCGLIGTYQASFWGAFENINSTRPELTVNTDGHGTVESLYDSVCTNGTTSILGIPEMGYVFSHWSDGDTTNPRTIVLTQDTSLTAYFTELPFNCSGVTLPYTSNFTQCWISDGGAIIIDSGHVKLNGEGQNTTSPWIHVSDSADLYLKVQTSGYSQGNAPTIECFILSSNGETRTTTWIINNNGLSSSMSLGTEYTGQSIQIGLTYLGTDTTTIFLTDVTLFQFGATVEISAPTIAYVGDTVVFAAQTSLPDGDYGLYVPYWYFFTQDWGTIPTGTIETTDYQRDTVKVVWSAPGEYIADFGYTVWDAYNGYPVYGQARQINITILDTTLPVPVSCDSIILPYTADFTQCWAVEGGASIIDATHTSLTSQGQRLVGPWMESVPGSSFFHFVYHCDDNHEWNSNQTVRITLENEDGVIVSWEDQIGNWGGRYRFDSPGGPIRASFEYTGSQSCNEFVVSDVAVYSYQIDVRLEAPAIATAGDTITLTAHATLQNGDMPDSYSWYMQDANWNFYWLSPESSSLGNVATVLSCSDSNLVMVINTTGRYPITTNIYKNMVYNNHDAYDDDWMYINIIDQSIYQEDSIYYTSAAKDTVIGCHPQLHVANLPDGVTVIADSAFFNHGSLSSVTLPHSLTHIGKCAFALTNGFSEITIPENVIFVGDNAFWSCLGLNTVNFNATNCQTMSPSTASDGSYWPVFIGCDNLTTFNIGENVTRIPDRAFSYCSGLHGTLTIPDAVTYIGRSAFYHWINDWDWDNGSSWDTLSIVLGAGLSEIGDYAFGCPRAHITSVISHNPVPPIIGEQTFYRYEPEYTPRLQVPCGSAAAYRNAQHWSRFEEIIEDCDGIEDVDHIVDTPAILSDNGIITIAGATELVSVYDMMGRLVSAYMPTDICCTIVVPHSGVYMVKIGDCPARKIVVVK